MTYAQPNADEEKHRRVLLAERLTGTATTLAEALAHEVHNPLNCALLQLAVLQRRLEQPDCQAGDVQPVAEVVEQSLRRLEIVFNDFVFLLQPSSHPPGGGPPPGLAEVIGAALAASLAKEAAQ
jgi:signal transduction histidine kinase